MKENEKLNEEDCEATVQLMLNLAKMAMLIPAEKYLVEIEHFNAFAPIFDPTAWLRKKDNLEEHRILARAVVNFKTEIEKIRKLGLLRKVGEG